jgi:ADP-ribose pyrophosphatase YjhB (NUDIX family)
MTNRQYPSRPWVSAFILIFNKTKDKILLVKRGKPPKKDYWFPPGGATNLGETVEAGIKREVLEETGLKITNLQFVQYLDVILPDNKGETQYHYIEMVFSSDSYEGEIKAGDDALEVRWVPLQDIELDYILVPKELIFVLND